MTGTGIFTYRILQYIGGVGSGVNLVTLGITISRCITHCPPVRVLLVSTKPPIGPASHHHKAYSWNKNKHSRSSIRSYRCLSRFRFNVGQSEVSIGESSRARSRTWDPSARQRSETTTARRSKGFGVVAYDPLVLREVDSHQMKHPKKGRLHQFTPPSQLLHGKSQESLATQCHVSTHHQARPNLLPALPREVK